MLAAGAQKYSRFFGFSTQLALIRNDIMEAITKSLHLVWEPVDVAINTLPQHPAAGHALRSWPKTSTTMDPAPKRLKHHGKKEVFIRLG